MVSNLNIGNKSKTGQIHHFFVFVCFLLIAREFLPDDHNYAIKDIVGVLDVAKGPVDQNLQQHLQGEEAGKHNVADLQSISQLVRLKKQRQKQKEQIINAFLQQKLITCTESNLH